MRKGTGFIDKADCIATVVFGTIEVSSTCIAIEMVAACITVEELSNLLGILTDIMMAGIATAKD